MMPQTDPTTVAGLLAELSAQIPLPMQALIAVLMIAGAFLMFVAGLGLIRMPDLFVRMSATTKAATLGVTCTLLSAALYFFSLQRLAQNEMLFHQLEGVPSRALAVILLVFVTAPVSAHMIGRAGYLADDVELAEETIMDELEGYYDIATRER